MPVDEQSQPIDADPDDTGMAPPDADDLEPAEEPEQSHPDGG
jgi:hypothetical protein